MGMGVGMFFRSVLVCIYKYAHEDMDLKYSSNVDGNGFCICRIIYKKFIYLYLFLCICIYMHAGLPFLLDEVSEVRVKRNSLHACDSRKQVTNSFIQ